MKTLKGDKIRRLLGFLTARFTSAFVVVVVVAVFVVVDCYPSCIISILRHSLKVSYRIIPF